MIDLFFRVFMFILLSSIIVGCESEKNVCIERFGDIRIVNQSSARQEIYVGQVIVEVGPGAWLEVSDVSVGTYKVVTVNLDTGVSSVITDFEVLPCDVVLIPILF